MSGNGTELCSYICCISVVGEVVVLRYFGELCRSHCIVPYIPVALVFRYNYLQGMRGMILLPPSTVLSKVTGK
jgi:hypothetical protein